MTLARRTRAWLFLTLSLAVLLPHVAIGQGIERPRVPVRTALDELRVLRVEYAEAFNKKDTAKLVGMYASDATLIAGDGAVLTGTEAIRKRLEAGPWMKMSIASDSVRVFGNTAWDLGTVRMAGSEGHEDVSHYLVVLRRGVTAWKINSVAIVPETSKGKADEPAGQ
jgi:ketosteroid isomerase-like protein